MNQKNTIFTAIFLAAGALAASVTGCELIASVDRSMINGTGGSGGGHTVGTGGMMASSTTSSSAASTTGTGGGTGGAMCGGGAMMCTTPQGCPDPMTECKTRTCAMGCCGTANVSNGVATMNGQTSGDCMKQVCDGNGATMMVVDATDVPANTDDCHTGSCSLLGTPSQMPNALGAACTSGGGKVCADPAGTSAGKCVQARPRY